MAKKPKKKQISEKERARRAEAAAKARGNDGTEPKKFAGADHHATLTAPRIIRHQGR
jgi:hypothetical protein